MPKQLSFRKRCVTRQKALVSLPSASAQQVRPLNTLGLRQHACATVGARRSPVQPRSNLRQPPHLKPLRALRQRRPNLKRTSRRRRRALPRQERLPLPLKGACALPKQTRKRPKASLPPFRPKPRPARRRRLKRGRRRPLPRLHWRAQRPTSRFWRRMPQSSSSGSRARALTRRRPKPI